MSETEVNDLNAKLECYESCVEQLRKEIPKYYAKYAEVGKENSRLVKVLRNLASLEADGNVQSTLFLCAIKYEQLQSERSILDRCNEFSTGLLDDAKEKVIAPLKVRLIALYNFDQILKEALVAKIQEVIADIKLSQSTLRKQESLIAQQAAKSMKSAIPLTKLEGIQASHQYTGANFVIHSRLFEKHRLKTIKRLISSMLAAELKYHCKAVEELTTALHAISEIGTGEQ